MNKFCEQISQYTTLFEASSEQVPMGSSEQRC